jgi:hypothetical protein
MVDILLEIPGQMKKQPEDSEVFSALIPIGFPGIMFDLAVGGAFG